jgi:hypothetical protein
MTSGQVSVAVAAACPFCGGHAAVQFKVLDARCACSRCGALGPKVTLFGFADVGGLNTAVEAWNRRVQARQCLPTEAIA